MRSLGWPVRVCAAGGLLLGVLVPGSPAQLTQRVSVAEDGSEAVGLNGSYSHSVSAHGRYVAFYSTANNLVPVDFNKNYDVFVRDTLLGTTVRASVDSAGYGGNGHSSGPVMAADGRWVAFVSDSTNLVPGDVNGTWDIFLHDLTTGTTTRESVGSMGQEGNDTAKDVPALTPDGRWLAFSSKASNLVPGDDNGTWDVFVRDLTDGRTVRVSVDSAGRQSNGKSVSPSLSADGRYVAFESDASNLAPDDGNGVGDVFVHDRVTGRTVLVSMDRKGRSGDQFSTEPSLSADGRVVVFASMASNLVLKDRNQAMDIFVRELDLGSTTLVSRSSDGIQGDSHSSWADLSANGRRITFASLAANLVPGDNNRNVDVFLFDRDTEVTECRSLGQYGASSNGSSTAPALSSDGLHVSFQSTASDLVSHDTNNKADQFLVGPALRLQASTDQVGIAQPVLSLHAWTGLPRGKFALFLVDVDGQPFRELLWRGRFDTGGILQLSGSLPPGWSGTSLTLQVIGEEALGQVGATNTITVILP